MFLSAAMMPGDETGRGMVTFMDMFPGFDLAGADPLAIAGMTDASNRTWLAPTFAHDGTKTLLIVDFVNPADRVIDEGQPRFSISADDEDGNEEILATDDWSEIVGWYAARNIPDMQITITGIYDDEGPMETDLGTFFNVNDALFEDAGPEIIAALQQHGEYRGGGGAAPEYTLTRRPA